jgi:4'-phosphopantetheinyl transferase EntD
MIASEHTFRCDLGNQPVWMAVVEVESLRQSAALAIDVRPDWLHRAEWHEAEVLTDRCRRWQWLAGRLAARWVLAAAGRCRGSDVRVLSRDTRGHPAPPLVFTGKTRLPGSLSIAHDGALAVAVVGLSPVGVDIVAPGRLPDSTARRWALDEARHKLRAGVAVPLAGRDAMQTDHWARGTWDPTAELVMTVRAHLVAVCTWREAA